MEGKKVSKFNYDEISVKNDHAKPFTQTISQINSKRICLCGNYNELKAFECFKCKEKVHYCVKVQINRPQLHGFECLSCMARAMDLIYQPQKILLETFYKTESIFERANVINFEFDLRFEDTKFPLDVRGLKGSKIELVWPMQGEFYLNGSKNPVLSLKPLKSNSNRKNRKEDTFMIEPNLLKEGKNILTYKIPRLEKPIVVERYKYEQTGIYFLALYSVKELKNQQVLKITQKQRRFEKYQTLQLFRQGDEDIPTEKQKVRLIDPYTSQRIKFPVRGRYCTHLATVCLVSYVSFQRNSRSWKCPICSVQSNSFMNEPYLDIWFHEILKDNSKGQNVYIHPNGTYEWQPVKQVAEVLDSDDDDEDIAPKKPNQIRQIIEEQPIITELQNFDLESHYQQSNQAEQINLIDYDEVSEIQPIQNDIWINRQDYQSEGQIVSLNDDQSSQQINANSDIQSMIGEPIIEEFAEPHQAQQDSQFEFPFNNDYVPSSKLQNVKVKPASVVPEKTENTKTPQIYQAPLQTKQKRFEQKPQSNAQQISPSQVMKRMNVLKQKLKSVENKHPRPINAQTQNLPISQQQPKLQNLQKDKFIGDKRLIQRPTFIQSTDQRVRLQQNQSADINRNQNYSLGRFQKKNIEWSQQRMMKNQPKIQQGLAKIFPPPPSAQQRSTKKEEFIPEKPKSQKVKTIKSLKCTPISHSKFVKEYCRIPIPPMIKRMNEDLKKIFAVIL